MSMPKQYLEELKQSLVSFFNSSSINAFVDGCIIEQLKQCVENNVDTLADKKAFSEEEIKQMKGCRLQDLKYDDITNDTAFKIFINTHDCLQFSNRMSTKGELRGGVLRDALDKLKKNNPNMTLYDALTGLIRAPTTMVTYFCSPLFFTDEKFMLSPERNSPNDNLVLSRRTFVIEALSKLSNACKTYVTEEKANGISDDELTKRLKTIIETNAQEIFLASLNEVISESSLSQFIKKQSEIKLAEKWIEDVFSLAKRYPEHVEKINGVAFAAQGLLEWCRSEHPKEQKGRELFSALQTAIEGAKTLPIERFSWKKMFEFFLNLVSNLKAWYKTGVKPSWFTKSTVEKQLPENEPNILRSSRTP